MTIQITHIEDKSIKDLYEELVKVINFMDENNIDYDLEPPIKQEK